MSARTFVIRFITTCVRGHNSRSLVALCFAWGLLVGSRMVYPVILPSIQSTFGLSLRVAGLLLSILWLSEAIGQLPGGVIADRYDERGVLALSTASVAVAIGGVILAPNSAMLFLATAVWGLGHSLFPVARVTLLSQLFSERLGRALGVTLASGDIGQTILPPIGAFLAVVVGWQVGLGFVIPLLFVSAFILSRTISGTSAKQSRTHRRSMQDAFGAIGRIRDRDIGIMTMILFLYMLIWQSFTAFYPTYLTRSKDIEPSMSSIIFGFFFAIGVFVKPLSGVAYDRLGTRCTLVGILLPPVAGFCLLPFVDAVWQLVVITAAISTMLGSGAVTQSYLVEAFTKETQGTGLGAIRTVAATLSSGGPVLFGVVADYGYFDEGYLGLAGITSVIIILTIVLTTGKQN